MPIAPRTRRRSPLTLLLPLGAFALVAAAPSDGCDGGEGDVDGDGYAAVDGDCDDADPTVNPAAAEVCGDGVDQDCDGIDPACAVTACYLGADRSGRTCHTLDAVGATPPSGYAYPAACQSSYGSAYAPPDHLLDLNEVDPAELFAPNFRADELAQSYKGQFAVVQPHAVASLQAVRDAVGVLVVNSGYRSPAYNASIDGASCSRHMYGDGFDLDPSSVSLSALGDTCYAKGAGYVQLYETHVHCDWRDDSLDPSFYRLPPGARAPGLPELDVTLRVDGGAWSAPAFGWDEGEPLRQWTALDEEGFILAQETGRVFIPPADAAFVEVVVGGEIYRRAALP